MYKMDNKTLVEYALKGIMSDIRELESKIFRGYNLIEQKKDKPSTVKKSFDELRDIINRLELEKKELSKKYDGLNWELSLLD